MKVIVSPSKLNGSIEAIASKSMAHRFLIAAALSRKACFINCSTTSDDIEATVECLNAMGNNIQRVADGFQLEPDKANIDQAVAMLPCNESGSTLRFLLPVVSALGIKGCFLRKGPLPKRPLAPLDSQLVKHGCSLTEGSNGELFIEGQLQAGRYELPGNVSSQYISGLLFALPLLAKNSQIVITTPMESEDYVKMTLETLQSFGIKIVEKDNVYEIAGKQSYQPTENISIEGDWSNSAFWITAGAIGSDRMSCSNLNKQSLQGDQRIVKLLQKMGGALFQTENAVIAEPTKVLTGITVDARKIPDLVPIIAVAASAASGVTQIIHAERLRMKESDRIKTVCSAITALGGNITETEDGMLIIGVGRLKGGIVDAGKDHRIAMMAAIAATISQENVIILHAEAVNKSYPDFWRDYEKLGGKIEVINEQ